MQPTEDWVPLNSDWQRRSHRDVQELLQALGWSLFAQGDWAFAYESPDCTLVARVAPFDPGYHFFVELCSRCRGNPYLPNIQLAGQLRGGGHLTVMEHLKPADRATTAKFEQQWSHPDQADVQLRELRREVEMMDQWGKQHHQRWWVGVDMGERHVLLSEDGHPKIIDLFGLGTPMLDDLIEDPLEFSRHISPDRCQYLLDMPDLQAPGLPDGYIDRLTRALAIVRKTAAR